MAAPEQPKPQGELTSGSSYSAEFEVVAAPGVEPS